MGIKAWAVEVMREVNDACEDGSENAKYKHAKKEGDQLKVDSITAFVDDFLAGDKSVTRNPKPEALHSEPSRIFESLCL